SSRRRHTSFSRDWSSDVCSSDLKSPLLLGIQRAHRHAQAIVAELARAIGRSEGLPLIRQCTDLHLDVLATAIADYLEPDRGIGFQRAALMWQVSGPVDGLAVDTQDHSTHPQPTPGRWPTIHHLRHQGASGTFQPKGLGQILVHILNHHAEPATADL